MRIELENVSVMYPNEDTGVKRRLILSDDGEWLQVDFLEISDDKLSGGMTLNKKQTEILRDALDLIIKNDLLEN